DQTPNPYCFPYSFNHDAEDIMDRARKVNYYEQCEKRIYSQNMVILLSVLCRYEHGVIPQRRS
ncbi:MAG: hypothetical protein ABR533_05880, partial [Desulfonatronovibrio sp.]